MAYRLTKAAEDQIDAVLLDSARNYGLEAAGRYGQLLLTAMAVLGADPRLVGSVEIPRSAGVLAFPIQFLRRRANRHAGSAILVTSSFIGSDRIKSWRSWD